jgi:hypothetical protein
LLGVDLAVLARYDAGTETIVAGWSASGDLEGIGTCTALGGRNVSTIVHETRRPVRIENYGEATGEIAAFRRAWGVRDRGRSHHRRGRDRGVMAVASTTDKPLPPTPRSVSRASRSSLATAYANAEAREALRPRGGRAGRAAPGGDARRARDATRCCVRRRRGGGGDAPPAAELALVGPVHAGRLDRVRRGLERPRETPSGSACGCRWEDGTSSTAGVRDQGSPVASTSFDEQASAVTDARPPQRSPLVGRRPDRGGGTTLGRDDRRVDSRAALPPGIERELAAFTELIATGIATAEARPS